MAVAVNVAGPLRFVIGKDASETAVTEFVGYSRDGMQLVVEPYWDDVYVDEIGPAVLKDRVGIGQKVFIEFELHTILRSVLEKLEWLYDTIGNSAQIGKKVSDIDGSGNSIWLVVESEAGNNDYRFSRIKPIRIVERIGTRHTTVTLQLEAIMDGNATVASAEFFDNDAYGASSAGNEIVEVAGGHVINIDAAPLGYTADGSEIVIEYQYDDVNVDLYGPETVYDAIVIGQTLHYNCELHAFDLAVLKDALALNVSSGYGKLNGVGLKATGSSLEHTILLDSILGASGLDWSFTKCSLEGRPVFRRGALHGVATLSFRMRPDGGSYGSFGVTGS